MICFIAIWTLGKKILSPLKALTSVMLLEGIQYYHLHAIDFSDNALLLSMWALTILFFFEALQKNDIRSWILTGLFSGLALMVKYFTGLLLLSMFLLLIKEYRLYFKTSPIYFGLCAFLLIITPHIIWLFSNNLMTLHYAIARTSAKYHWYNHMKYPAQFALEQLETLIPFFYFTSYFFSVEKKFMGREKNKKLFYFYRNFTICVDAFYFGDLRNETTCCMGAASFLTLRNYFNRYLQLRYLIKKILSVRFCIDSISHCND